MYAASPQLAFTSRARCYNQWQSAESELKRIKQVHEKARSQGRISQDRMGHSMNQVADVCAQTEMNSLFPYAHMLCSC